MEKTKRFIEVSFQQAGIHRYPAALEDPKLAKVSYLGYAHRHVFHFYVKMEVWHNDREVEFILLKNELQGLYSGQLELDYKSCEMLAEGLLTYLNAVYPGRDKVVRVYEDDENGAIIEYYRE